LFCQYTMLPWLEVAQQDRPDSSANEAPHWVSNRLQHPPNLPFPALVEYHADPGSLRLPPDQSGAALCQAAVQRHALRQVMQCFGRWSAIQQRQILLFHLVSRMSDRVGEASVVGENQQAL